MPVTLDARDLKTLHIVEISAACTLLLGAAALLFPVAADKFFRGIERSLARFAESKRLAVFVLLLSVIVVRLLALPLLHVPVPGIHDEFSYLLMGDTFAHGRLANPPHPMWISFESFHVNWFPKYASMYPPAQGLVLALGQILGHPWIGVLLSDAAMCGAILWMLQGWLPARWAFLGGVLAALKLGIASYWMNSYWGGATAAIGGALVLGALPRIVRRARIGDVVFLGLGIAILANSRPYEGFLFCIPASVWFAWWLAGKIKSPLPLRVRAGQVLLPLAAMLVLTAASMGYYNWRLTGNPFLLPHVLNTHTYHTTGLFLWDHKKPEMHYANQQFEEFYNGWERSNYDNTWPDIMRISEEKLVRYGLTYFWVGEFLALPAIPFLFRNRKMRLALVTFLLVTAGSVAVIWSNAHYAAPLTCVVFVLAVQAIRYMRTMRIGARPVADKLARTPGKHLIMVRYEKDNHNIHDDWVYNGAEIDNAKVLWARDLDAGQNAKLFAYFSDRKVWLVTPDSDNTYLEPYTSPDSPRANSDE